MQCHQDAEHQRDAPSPNDAAIDCRHELRDSSTPAKHWSWWSKFGCGKSTLARLVTMIERPTSGEFEIKGVNGVTWDKNVRRKLRKEIQIIFQAPYGSLNPRKKVGAILEEPLKINTDMDAARRRELSMDMMVKVAKSERLKRIRLKGELPSPLDPPSGCTFHKRCVHMTDICAKEPPEIRELHNRKISCHHAEKIYNSES